MKEIRIVDKVTGEVKNIECNGFNIQYIQSNGNGRIQRLTKLNNGKYGEKYWIKNYIYQPIALKIKQSLMEQVTDLSCINIEKILFIEDTNYVADEIKNNNDWVMRIKKAPNPLTEYTGYLFIIESRGFWMERCSNEQVVAHIYSCLRQIDGTGLKEPDVKGWKEVLGTLGYGWEKTLSPIPNLMNIMEKFEDDDFNMLKKADKQLRLDLRELKVVK